MDDTVREDIGYMKYELEITDIHGDVDKIKIEYPQGLMVGMVNWERRIIAEDLIERGYAKEVK